MSIDMNNEIKEYDKKYNEDMLLLKYNILNKIVIIPKMVIDPTYKPVIEIGRNKKNITNNKSIVKKSSKKKGGVIVITND